MKKTLIAAGLIGLLPAIACSQTNVTIYGVMDTGLVKETGSDVRMGNYMSSRLGFKGTEDLGGGNKATFGLEQRFRLNSGVPTGDYTWDESLRKKMGNTDNTKWTGHSNVGLAGQWGAVRVGRIMTLVAETFTMIDPFDQNGIASSFSVNALIHSQYTNNTIRYDSPRVNGLEVGLTYSLGDDKHGETEEKRFLKRVGNDGFAISPRYTNGPLMLLANFERVPDSDNSYRWDVGGTYQFGNLKAFLGFEKTIFKLDEVTSEHSGNQNEWLAGLQYQTGPHTFLTSFDRGEIDAGAYDGHANRYALGYYYNFSKRTMLYGIATYVDSSNDLVGSIYNSNGTERDSMTGLQIGINHKF